MMDRQTVVTGAGYRGPALDIEQLQAARLWVAHHRPYYAAVLYRCPVVVTDAVPTMAVDRHWRMYVNPVFAATLSVPGLAAVLIHEVNHLIRNHADRADAMAVCTAGDHHRWNLAGDAEINDDLLDDGLALDREVAVLPSTLGCRRDQTAEQYYAVLRDEDDCATTGDDTDCGSGAGGTALPGELPADDERAPAVLGTEARVIRRRVAEDIRSGSTGRGSVPGGLVEWAHRELSPAVDWRRVLGGAVRGALAAVAGSADFTYARFARRTAAIPQVRLPGMIDRPPAVAVVIDTSGSMSTDQIAQAFSEVHGILRSSGVPDRQVTVLTVDAQVAAIKRLTDVRRISTMGRGGTDMTVGIEAAAALRPRPEVIVVLTDGFTDWPEAPLRGIRLIVGLVGIDRADLEHFPPPPWATTVDVTLV